LPVHTFSTDDGDIAMKCPTEIAISDRREFELSNLGFMPLLHSKGRDYAVFMGAQSAQKPKTYFDPDANANGHANANTNANADPSTNTSADSHSHSCANSNTHTAPVYSNADSANYRFPYDH
jgi:hypothetical protein